MSRYSGYVVCAPAAQHFRGQPVPLGDFFQKRIGSRKMILRNLLVVFAHVAAHTLAWIEDPTLAAFQQFGQESRIDNYGDDTEIVPVPHPMFGEGGFVTARDPVAPEAWCRLLSMFPSQTPMDNPCQIWRAGGRGCGRSSIEIVRSIS